MSNIFAGPPDRVYYEQGYRPGQEQQEDAEPQEGGRGGYEAALTAEEAEWEWQRQLAEQQDSQDEDVWYVCCQLSHHALKTQQTCAGHV